MLNTSHPKINHNIEGIKELLFNKENNKLRNNRIINRNNYNNKNNSYSNINKEPTKESNKETSKDNTKSNPTYKKIMRNKNNNIPTDHSTKNIWINNNSSKIN